MYNTYIYIYICICAYTYICVYIYISCITDQIYPTHLSISHSVAPDLGILIAEGQHVHARLATQRRGQDAPGACRVQRMFNDVYICLYC